MTTRDSTRCACGQKKPKGWASERCATCLYASVKEEGWTSPLASEPVGAMEAQELRQALARATPAEGEAVAWMLVDHGGNRVGTPLTEESFANETAAKVRVEIGTCRVIPLYTTPPRSPATVTEEVATDLSECERWVEEIRHWVDETVPEPALGHMLAALGQLEDARVALGGRDAE